LDYRANKYRITYLIGFVILFNNVYTQVPINLNCRPTIWANNKTSALSITFDDGSYNQFTVAMPILNKWNFKATYYIISGYVDAHVGGVTWDTIRKTASYGHEIASHTVNHAALVSLSTQGNIDSIKEELSLSKNKIDSNVTNQKCLTMAYPWAWHNKIVDSLTALYYIAGRTAGYLEDQTPSNYYGLAGVIVYPNTTMGDLNQLVDYNNRWGDWLIEIWHGIDSGGWGPIPHSSFDQHLGYVNFRKNLVWVETVQNIIKYIKERQHVYFYNQFLSNNKISFNANDSLIDSIYDYPLTVKFEIPGYFNKVDSILQHGKKVKYFMLSYWNRDFLYLNILPDTSKVTVYLKDSLFGKPKIYVSGKKILCYGDSIRLTAQYGYKYYWSTGDTTRNIWVKKSGKYTLQIKTNPYNYSHVSDTLFVNIPPAIYKPIIITDKTPFLCLGDSVRLSTTPGYKKYIWNGIETSSDIYVKSNGSFNVYLIDSSNCQTLTSEKVKVTVFNLPSVPEIVKVPGVSHCDGESIQLAATAGYMKYIWNTGDTTERISIGHAAKVSVHIFDSNNCPSSWSDPYIVPFLFSFFHPKISVESNTTQCEGNTVMLAAPENYYAYEWSDGSKTRILEAQKGGKYFLKIFDQNMCPSANSDTVDVQFIPRPVKPDVIVKGNDHFCKGDSVILSSPDKYNFNLWSDNEHSPEIVVKKSGKYSLVMRNANGCLSPISDPVDIFVIEIPEKPIITLTEDLCLKSTISGDSYNWKFNDINLNNNSSIINASKYGKGLYQVMVGNENCNSVYSDIYTYNPVSITNYNNIKKEIIIYYTTEGAVEITISGAIKPKYIEILNYNGNLLMRKEIKNNLLKVDFLKRGEYILKVTANEGIFSQKFVIQ
jgi:peptidoglycan/xylan/chitin deacetylase (PgdA/CDA1 family)